MREERALAVVTGASSGIGQAYARRLARGPYDLVVVARRRDRLDALKRELGERHGTRVETFVADLADEADLRRVADQVEGLANLAFLVHAAGFSTRGDFAARDIERQIDMVRLHDIAALRLARAALPGMIDRRRGAIVLVSSTAAWAAAPGNIAYGATKAFLNAFCEGLATELRGTGVRVQALCPGLTRTEFHDTPEFAGFNPYAVPRLFWMSPDEVVVQSLRALRTDRVVVVTGRLNRLYTELARFGFVRALARRSITALRRGSAGMPSG